MRFFVTIRLPRSRHGETGSVNPVGREEFAKVEAQPDFQTADLQPRRLRLSYNRRFAGSGNGAQINAGQQFSSGVKRRHLLVSLQLPIVGVRMPLHRQLPITPLDLVGSERERQVHQPESSLYFRTRAVSGAWAGNPLPALL